MYYTSLCYIVLVQRTYELTGRCSRFPLSRQAAHVAGITDKPESMVTPIINHCTICCTVCNGYCAVGWSSRFPAVDYK